MSMCESYVNLFKFYFRLFYHLKRPLVIYGVVKVNSPWA